MFHCPLPVSVLYPHSLFVSFSQKEAGDGWFSWIFGKKKEAQMPADTGKSVRKSKYLYGISQISPIYYKKHI